MAAELRPRPFDMQGKVVAITGATGVLGSAYCRRLAELGADLAMADLPGRDHEARARELAKEFGVRAIGIDCDVSSEPDVRALFQRVKQEHGRVDVVLNNAAVTGEHLMRVGSPFAPFEEYSLDVWRRVLDTNLTGVFLVAREGGALLRASGGGSLINVASIYGIVGPDHRIYEGMPFSSFAPYSASKAGVHGLTLWLATYWGDKGIRVNTLVPGGVENGQPALFVQRYANRTPMGRMATPEDLCGAVAFLSSDASRYVTGQLIVVDGGLSAW